VVPSSVVRLIPNPVHQSMFESWRGLALIRLANAAGAAEHSQLANAAAAATAAQSGKLQGVPFAVRQDARRSPATTFP
jgi:hypothetical protein